MTIAMEIVILAIEIEILAIEIVTIAIEIVILAMEIVILAMEIESNAMEIVIVIKRNGGRIIAITNSGSVRFVDCWLVANKNCRWIVNLGKLCPGCEELKSHLALSKHPGAERYSDNMHI